MKLKFSSNLGKLIYNLQIKIKYFFINKKLLVFEAFMSFLKKLAALREKLFFLLTKKIVSLNE